MATIEDILTEQKARQSLYARMDKDEGLYNLDKYTMREPGVDGKEIGDPIPGIINVTLNLPGVFAAHVQANLVGASEQVVVSGPDIKRDGEQPHVIERIVKAAVRQADRRLRLRGDFPSKPVVVENMDIRGRAGVRVKVWVENDTLVIDFVPMDTRYFTYGMGINGMEWGGYTTQRTPADILSEFPEYKFKPGEKESPKGITVVDLWDRDTEKVYIGTDVKKPFVEQDNPDDGPPFAFEIAPIGSMLKTTDAVKRRGESIFYLIRDLVPHFNRFMSIAQTHNERTVTGHLLWHGEEGEEGEPPDELHVPGKVTSASHPNAATMVPTTDIRAAGRLVHATLSRLIQIGSASMTEFGNLQFPLSAVALVELSESSGAVFLPRLGAVGLLYEQIAEMIIKGIKDSGVTRFRLGVPGHMEEFNVSDLEGEYTLSYRYTPQSPQTDMARYAIAEVAKGLGMPEDYLWEEIMRVENPAELKRQQLVEKAAKISPAIEKYDILLALIEAGQDVRAKMLAAELGVTIEQVLSGELVPPQPSTNGKTPASAANLFGPVSGGRSQSNTEAALLGGQVGEGEGEE